jgi:hypothetical protein
VCSVRIMGGAAPRRAGVWLTEELGSALIRQVRAALDPIISTRTHTDAPHRCGQCALPTSRLRLPYNVQSVALHVRY